MVSRITDTYVALDLETTGLNPKRDRIMEIGALKVVNGKETACFSTLVNPGRRLEQRVSELTGITDRMLEEAPEEDEALSQLLAFAGDSVLVGHRILFDFSFVKKAAVNRGREFERSGIDTLGLAKRFLPELKSRSLSYLCGYYGIAHTAHRAFGDAQAASGLYRKLLELFYEDHEEAFVPQELRYQAKRDFPATGAQKERLYKLLERHRLVIDDQVERLTRSEASRLTDRIRSEYGE